MREKRDERLRAVMLGGTGSDVGKSVLAAGLCRIFKQDGYSPAPFKAQNMALNSYPTPDGLEIGRAQAVQAEAAGIACTADMNPLLLKPSGERTSQVVLMGRPIGNRDAYSYYRREGRDELRKTVNAAYDRLAAQYNPIVMEGAGSIAELNLRDTDLVNMPMARHAGAAVILVADIDRGGVFASVYGSIMLQDEADRKLIKGVIVNKFRGDMRLFDSGRELMERLCGVPVLGVVPYMTDIEIDQEDSVALDRMTANGPTDDGRINVAVVRLPYISNYTDMNALAKDERVNLYYTDDREELKRGDIVIIPGSKSTIADLKYLQEKGLDKAIKEANRRGAQIVGICGGYQMLGELIEDPHCVETGGSIEGLGLLPTRTVLTKEKVTRRVKFRARIGNESAEGDGYEIHMGKTERMDNGECGADHERFATTENGETDGLVSVERRVLGTYLHGAFDSPGVIDLLLGKRAGEPGESPMEYRERQYDLLADRLREYIDMEKLYKIMESDD